MTVLVSEDVYCNHDSSNTYIIHTCVWRKVENKKESAEKNRLPKKDRDFFGKFTHTNGCQHPVGPFFPPPSLIILAPMLATLNCIGSLLKATVPFHTCWHYSKSTS